MLQQHSSLKTIKKKLVRKALDMIRKIADEDPDDADRTEKKGLFISSSMFVARVLHHMRFLILFHLL